MHSQGWAEGDIHQEKIYSTALSDFDMKTVALFQNLVSFSEEGSISMHHRRTLNAKVFSKGDLFMLPWKKPRNHKF